MYTAQGTNSIWAKGVKKSAINMNETKSPQTLYLNTRQSILRIPLISDARL